MDEPASDVAGLFRRFGRIEEIVGLAAAELAGRHRPEVANALVDTCDEAVRVAEVALRLAAEEDLWPLLPPAAAMWLRLADLVELGQAAGAEVPSDHPRLEAVAGQLQAVNRARDAVGTALAELAAHPGDTASNATVIVATDELRRAGDHLVAAALETSGTLRLDAAVAVLTAVEATACQAERERAQLHETG